jgi:DNA-binding transcriptional regulator LsrR (DeoR family)
MDTREAAVRQELMERVRHKHQRPDWLIQNVSNKLGVSGDVVHGILDQLVAEGELMIGDVKGIEMVSVVKK